MTNINTNTGYRNTGYHNTGDYNTGSWNTITPDEILIFNKPGKRKDLANADIPEWMLISLTSWVSKSEMTDKEKEAYPSYVTTGGYLKVYSCPKAAYIKAWEKADKEDRDKTFKLPNFDPVVFEEITLAIVWKKSVNMRWLSKTSSPLMALNTGKWINELQSNN